MNTMVNKITILMVGLQLVITWMEVISADKVVHTRLTRMLGVVPNVLVLPLVTNKFEK